MPLGTNTATENNGGEAGVWEIVYTYLKTRT
jgi:hypothetical protein